MEAMEEMQHVAAYCRVSTDKEDQRNSLENQRSFFVRKLAENPEWEMKEIYVDEGITGTSLKHRRNFKRMYEDAMAGKIDLILTKEVSRFARNTVDALIITRELKRNGVGVVFLLDHIDTRENDGELRLTLMASLAQEESRKTSERVKFGQRRQMEKGVVFGRKMLGYDVIEGELRVNKPEAALVKKIYEMYLAEGKGSRRIAEELTEAGIMPMYSDHWTNTVILKILKNEKYAGNLCQGKTKTVDFLTHERRRNEKGELVVLKNHHEAIIEETVWRQVQEEICNRAKYKERGSQEEVVDRRMDPR